MSALLPEDEVTGSEGKQTPIFAWFAAVTYLLFASQNRLTLYVIESWLTQ
jgi:hypothetical protein